MVNCEYVNEYLKKLSLTTNNLQSIICDRPI